MNQDELKKRIEWLLAVASDYRKEGLQFYSLLDSVRRLEQLYDDLYGE